uniref:Ovule protein n=1 Tax=Heterorhabditis bacteriophora TaxID=37862 RepID=A0A1I7WUE1_HETBA
MFSKYRVTLLMSNFHDLKRCLNLLNFFKLIIFTKYCIFQQFQEIVKINFSYESIFSNPTQKLPPLLMSLNTTYKLILFTKDNFSHSNT